MDHTGIKEKNNLQRQRNKKSLLATILISGAIGVLFFLIWFFLFRITGSRSSTQTPRPVNSVDYSSPTKQEQSAGNDQKQVNVKKAETEAGQTNISTANVEISYATQYNDTVEVRGFVSNVYENGTCTAVFSRSGSTSVSTASVAFKDASSTQCGANDTPRSKFDVPGIWKVVLTYTSASGVTGSSSTNVKVE